MKKRILFPYDLENENPQAYSFAIDMARRLKYNLTILTCFDKPQHTFFTAKSTDGNLARLKEKAYCSLLKMNGLYQGKFNKWESYTDIQIKTILREGDIRDAIDSCLEIDEYYILLLDFQMGSSISLSSWAVNSLREKNIRLWLMPQNIEAYALSPDLSPKFFKLQKKEVFGEVFCGTKLYCMPNDIIDFKKDFC